MTLLGQQMPKLRADLLFTEIELPVPRDFLPGPQAPRAGQRRPDGARYGDNGQITEPPRKFLKAPVRTAKFSQLGGKTTSADPSLRSEAYPLSASSDHVDVGACNASLDHIESSPFSQPMS